MKKIAYLILTALFFLLLPSCKKTDTAPSGTNIFVGGNEASMPKYWQNGKAILLTGNYDFAEVNRAIDESDAGTAVKPVLRMPG